MSLILDALNKADKEDNRTDVPTYASDHDFAPDTTLPKNDNLRFIIILVLCALFAIALTLILTITLIKDDSATQQTPTQVPLSTTNQNQTSQAKNTVSAKEAKPNLSAADTSQKLDSTNIQPNASAISDIRKPTRLTTVKTPAPNIKPSSAGSTDRSTNTANAVNGNTDRSTDRSSNGSNTNLDVAQRNALIAAQYQNSQKTNQTTDQQIETQIKPTTVAKPSKDAISAIYQNIETESTVENTEADEFIEDVSQSIANELAETQFSKPEKPEVKAPPKVDNTLAKYPNLNFIHDLPFSTQNKIPTIMYTVHNYDKQSPSVTLNKKPRRVGEKIATSLTLDEILEDGIVLKYNTVRFKMMALNSWINM